MAKTSCFCSGSSARGDRAFLKISVQRYIVPLEHFVVSLALCVLFIADIFSVTYTFTITNCHYLSAPNTHTLFDEPARIVYISDKFRIRFVGSFFT